VRYYPGWTHTGENWYGISENAAGADVIAVAAGTVRYADYDYPGRVVIVEHDGGLFSVYGHLDYTLPVTVGDKISRGQRIGAVLARPDEFVRSHLHFEIRSFFLQEIVNGEAPMHGTNCGYRCPPGPGYWPANAPEHPADLGWLNPTHVIARNGASNLLSTGAELIVTESAEQTLPVWSNLPWRSGSRQVDVIPIAPGDRFALEAVKTGSDASRGRSAAGYRLWYRIELSNGDLGWVNSIEPDFTDRNSDGAPSGVRFNLLPIPETTS
jgi:murein DD-endopeptidase MepM/ murein hydrolase activator NlpD